MRLNDSEWTVMGALWEASERGIADVTARDIHGLLGDSKDWAYTTLRTLLARLVEKGAIAERKIGNQSIYTPLVTQEAARTSAVRSLLERAFDGTVGSLLQHLAARERLSGRDRERLQALVDEVDGTPTSRAPTSKAPTSKAPTSKAAARGGHGSEPGPKTSAKPTPSPSPARKRAR